MASPPINHDPHIRNANFPCELWVDEEIPGLGFSGGTYGPVSYPGPPGSGPANAYIHSHLQPFQFPAAYEQPPFTTGVAYMSGVWVGFSEFSRIVGGADQFFVDVYVYNQDIGFENVGSYPFSLPANIPSPNIVSSTDFTGYLNFLYANPQAFFIPFDLPVYINSADLFVIGLRVKTPTSNDLISFYYTYGEPGQECYATRWRVAFADVNTHQLLPFGSGGLPIAYNSYWGGQEAYGNPVIIPQITFEDDDPQDCDLQIVDGQVSDVRCYGGSDGRLFGLQTVGAQGAVDFRVQLVVDASGIDVSGQNIFFTPSGPGVFTNLPAGDYTLFATDLGVNCTINTDFSIEQPDLFGFFTETNIQAGTIAVNAFGGTPGYSYSIVPTVGFLVGNVFSGLQPGTYFITVTDANGCQVSDEVVLQDCDLSFSYSVTSGSCDYSAPNTLNIMAMGGTPPYTYFVGASSYTSPSISGLGQGTDVVYVVDAAGCESPAVTLTLGPLNANVFTQNPTGGLSNGSAMIMPIGGSPQYQVSINPANGFELSEGEFVNLPAGTYQYTISDGNGCSYSSSFTLTDGEACPYAVSHEATPAGYDCLWDVTFFIEGGTPPFLIEGIEVFGFPYSFTGVGSGDYTVTIEDATGCITLYDVNVPFLGLPTVSIVGVGNPSPGNSDGTITVSASGTSNQYTVTLYNEFNQTTYTWVVQNGGSYTFENLPPSIYRACATDDLGCESCTQQIALDEVGTDCFADNIFTEPSCAGEPTGVISFNIINGNAPYNVSVSGVGNLPQTFSSFIEIEGLSAGFYNVVINDNAGCSTSFQIFVDEYLPAFAEWQVVCANPGVNDGSISVNTTGTPRLFDQFATEYFAIGNTFTGLPAAAFRLEVFDGNTGCTTLFNINDCFGDPCSGFEVNTEINAASPGNADGSVVFYINGGGSQFYSIYNNGLCSDPNEFVADGFSPLFVGGLSEGLYTFCVTSDFGCSQILDVFVPAAEGLQLFLNYSTNPTSGANGIISVFATGGAGIVTYFLYDANGNNIASNTTGFFDGLPAGLYRIDAVDENGSGSNEIEVVLQECNLNANFFLQVQGCTSASAGFQAIGGVPPYTYFSNGSFLNVNSSGNFTAFGLSLGCNILSVRDGNGCEVSQTLCVEGLEFAFLNVTNPNDNGPGRFDVAIANGSAPYTVFLNGDFQATTSNPLLSFENLDAGVYCVRVQDAQGCTYDDCITLSAGCGFGVTTEITQIGCAGATDGEILLCVTGGVGALEYSTDNGLSWYPFFGTCENFFNLAAGTYVFLVRDASGCIEQLQDIVLQPQFPAFDILNVSLNQPTPGLCNGGIVLTLNGGLAPYTATVNAQPAGTFFSQIINLSGQCGGTKTVCITDQNGCTVCEQLLLDCGISASIASVTPSCAGQTTGSLTVSAIGGVPPLRYSLNGINFQTSPVFTGLAAGSYTIIIQDAALCDQTISESVSSADAPNIQIAQIDPDQNQSNGQIWVDVFGGVSPIRIRLISLSTNQTVGDQLTSSFQFTGLPGGCYSVEVQDGAGCVYAQQVCLAQPCSLTVDASSNGTSFCAGEVIELFAQSSEEGVSYQWTGLGMTGPTNMNMAAAVHFTNPCSNQGSCLLGYEVVARNAEGCEARDTVIVRFIPAVTITALGPVEYVQGAVINTILTASGPGNAQVQWFLDNVAIQGANSTTFTATQAGCYSAGININGQFFACNTGAVCITDDIIAGVQADTIFYCDGDDCVNVTAVGPAGTQFYWTPPGGLSSQFGETVCIRPRRTTTYSVTMTDANGNLIAVDEFVVVRRQRPVVSVVPQGSLQFCQGAFVDLVGLYNPNYEYTWLRNGQVVQQGTGQANATYRATQTGAYVLRVTDMVTGCSREGLAVPVNANPAPFEFAVTPTSAFICGGDEATFTASVVVPGNPNPSVVFTWTLPNGSTFIGEQLTTDIPGTYSVTAQVSGFECVPTRTVSLQVSNLAVAQTNITICNGQTTTLTATGANSYTWTNFITGEVVGMGSTLTVSPSANAAYQVTSDCGQTATVTVAVLPFDFNPPSDVYICANNPFDVTLSLTAPFPQIVQWYLGDLLINTGTSIQVNPFETTVYRVVGSNLNGCTEEALITVFVADEDLIIDFDGNPASLNDDYELICAEEFYQFDPIVRNSSGEAITSGLNYRWDWIEGDSDFTPAQQFTRNPSIQVFTTTTFTLTVNGAGCQVVRTITLETLPAINAIATGPTALVCSGGGAQLNVVFTDGSNPNAYAYEWLPGASLNNPFVSAPIATPAGTTTYTVVITDPNTGCQINREVTVNVSSTPVIADISGPSIVNRCSGETFNFETPDAGANAQYFWYVNNVLAEGPPFSSRFFNWNQGGLYRVDVVAGDCQATAEKIVLNNDQALPPTSFAYDCATNLVSWMESQSGLVEQIEWLPASSPSTFIWNVLQVDISNSYQGDMTQYYLPLSPGFYRLRIRSRCGAATSEYVTLNAYVCGPCEDAGEIILAPNPDGTSILVSWNVVPNAAGYVLELGTVNGNDYTWSGVESFTTQNTTLLTGLTSGINYAVRVRTQCDPGGTNFSDYIEAEFNLSQQPCDAPALTVTPNNCSSATLSWTAAAGAANYRVEIVNNATGLTQTIEPVTGTTYTANGLAENTTYTFRVRTNCSSGFNSNFTTAVATIPICPQPCFPVTNIRFRNVTAGGVTVEWNPPANNQFTTGYTVEIRRSGTFELVAGPVSTPSTSVTLPLPGTVANEYVAIVRTNCQGGSSAEETQLLVAEQCYFPGTADFNVATPSATSIVVSWDAPSSFVYYIIRLLDENNVQQYSSGYIPVFNESYTFANVQAGRSYILYVTVVCEFNDIVIDDIFLQNIQMPAVCAAPQGPLVIFNTSTDGFTAVWEPAVANPDIEELPSGYVIEVRETIGNALVYSETLPGSATSNVELSGLGLTQGVSYTVFVYGDCALSDSDPISASFLIPIPVCGTPTIVSFVANAEQFSLSWTAGAGNVVGYRVDIDGFDGTVISESLPATTTQIIDYVFATPLDAGTYTVSVTAICDDGDLFSGSATQAFLITGPVCLAPSDVEATATGLTTVNVSWNAPANGSAVNYNVFLYDSNNLLLAQAFAVPGTSTTLSLGAPLLTGSYTVEVFSNCLAGVTAGPATDGFAVVVECSAPVFNDNNINAQSPTYDQISVSWVPALGATYAVEYWNEDLGSSSAQTATIIDNINGTALITGLDYCVRYQIRLRAFCPDGQVFTAVAPTAVRPSPTVSLGTITSNSAVVNWIPVTQAQSITVRTRNVTDGTGFGPAVTLAPGITNFTVTQTAPGTPLLPGTQYETRITFVFPAGSGCTSLSVLVRYTTLSGGVGRLADDATVSADDMSAFSVYPNPNRGVFTVSFDATTSGSVALRLFDMNGRNVEFRTLEAQEGTNSFELDMTDRLPSGLYLLQVAQGASLHSTKLVVE